MSEKDRALDGLSEAMFDAIREARWCYGFLTYENVKRAMDLAWLEVHRQAMEDAKQEVFK